MGKEKDDSETSSNEMKGGRQAHVATAEVPANSDGELLAKWAVRLV